MKRQEIINRQINGDIKMSDSTFGITLELWEHMPKNVFAEKMLLEIIDKNGNIINKYVLLPHQLYLHNLKEMSHNGEYDVFVTPKFQEYERIKIFEDESQIENKSTDLQDEKQ